MVDGDMQLHAQANGVMETVLIEERGTIRSRGLGSRRSIFPGSVGEIRMSGWTKPSITSMYTRCHGMRGWMWRVSSWMEKLVNGGDG